MSLIATTDADRNEAGSPALWASAVVILAMVIAGAGARFGGGQARADVATVGDIVTTNIRSAVDEDVVAVLDSRSEIMLIYRVENRVRVELVQSLRLPEVFAEAKGLQGTGGRR